MQSRRAAKLRQPWYSDTERLRRRVSRPCGEPVSKNSQACVSVSSCVHKRRRRRAQSDSQLCQFRPTLKDAPPHLPDSVAMASAVESRTNGSRGNQDGVLAGYCAEQCTKVLFGSCAGTNRQGRASARGWGTSYASCTETMPHTR